MHFLASIGGKVCVPSFDHVTTFSNIVVNYSVCVCASGHITCTSRSSKLQGTMGNISNASKRGLTTMYISLLKRSHYLGVLKFPMRLLNIAQPQLDVNFHNFNDLHHHYYCHISYFSFQPSYYQFHLFMLRELSSSHNG